MSEEEIIKKAENLINNKSSEAYMGSITEYFIELYKLYQQEKEKRKTLESLLQGNLYALYLYYKERTIENEETINTEFINKDKIRAKIKELEKQAENVRGLQGLRYSESGYIQSKINVLKKLLEEK